MRAELEAILKAYDAARQAASADEKRLVAIYYQKLDDVLSRHPNLPRATLERMVEFAYRRWVKAESKPSSMPPHA